jgi:bifunctional UDP-N-acetylglucosamine pyrophosphorylase/glucosamine-1-phosphate N-acetyltransferase
MKSSRPKPLHLLAGRAMLLYVLDSLATCEVTRVVVVVGHGAERVTKKLQAEEPDLHLTFVEQHQQRGTGDAASVGLTGLPDDDGPDADDDDVLVLPGDMPLLRPATIAALVHDAPAADAACTVLTARGRRPGRLRPGHPRAGTGRSSASWSEPTPRPTSVPIARSTPRCTASAATLLAPALRRSAPTTPRASTTSPTWSAVLARATGWGRHRRGARGRDRGRQRPLAAGRCRARAAQPHQPNGCSPASPCSTRPDLPRRHRAARAATSRSTRAPSSRATPWWATAARSAPTPASPTARWAPARRRAVGRPRREVGAGAHVGPYAYLPPAASVPSGAVTGAFYTAPAPTTPEPAYGP